MMMDLLNKSMAPLKLIRVGMYCNTLGNLERRHQRNSTKSRPYSLHKLFSELKSDVSLNSPLCTRRLRKSYTDLRLSKHSPSKYCLGISKSFVKAPSCLNPNSNKNKLRGNHLRPLSKLLNKYY